MQDGSTALIMASRNEHVEVVNRLLDWQQTQIREGFNLSFIQGVPTDIIDLIFKFTY